MTCGSFIERYEGARFIRISRALLNIFNKKYMENKATIRLYIDGKEMLYSHQNIIGAINSFLPYLTNDDLDELMLRFHSLKDHRRQKEAESKLEVEKHSWPYPDTKITAHDTPVQEHEMT